jgi:rare lipoprotein A
MQNPTIFKVTLTGLLFVFSLGILFAQQSAIDSTWQPIYRDTGIASYYASKLEGRLTANGERYHKNQFTAAHKTLPFGTLLKVTNPQNHKWVVVRVNDRGPHHPKRIIDLSYRAAKHLGLTRGGGLVKVYIEEVPQIGSAPKE